MKIVSLLYGIMKYYADKQGIKVNIDVNTDTIIIENDFLIEHSNF